LTKGHLLIKIKSFFSRDQSSRSRRVKTALGLFFSLAYVTSFGCLYLGLLNASWVNRLVILAISTPLILLLMYGVIFKLLRLGQGFSRKVWGGFGLVAITVGALLWPVYRSALPPTPARHTLEITVLCDRSTPSSGVEVQILSINRLAVSSNEEIPVASREVEQVGSWQVGNGGWYTDCEQPSSLRFSEFIYGGVTIDFKPLSDNNLVQVTWDGRPQKLHFYFPKDQVQAVRLLTNTPGAGLTAIWKILVALLWISDFISTAGLVFLISFIFYTTYWRPRLVKAFVLDFLPSIYQLCRLLVPVVSRRTILALVLPILLLVGILINFLVIGENLWIDRLSSNDLMAFARESAASDGNSIVYFYILNHYLGRTLVINPTLLDQTRLSREGLVGLSRIGQVEDRPYRVNLSQSEAASLQDLPNYLMPARRYLRFSYRFFDSPEKTDKLCLQRFGDEIFMGPVSLLPGCKEAQ
jgi:hypothetical protein